MTEKDIMDKWLQSRKKAVLEGISLRPRESCFLRGTALIVSRGQASVFFLQNGSNWILKKFLPGRQPNMLYIKAIQTVLPKNQLGFESGTQRKVLSGASISRQGFFSQEIVQWLDQTVLMPEVSGIDWAGLADILRKGKSQLTSDQRRLVCRNLSEQIAALENNSLSHRDLSSTNIMIDTQTWQVHLIDWDSLYHPTLQMPGNTTFGTEGYVSPLVGRKGTENPKATWRVLSDRFSLAVLNMELLALTRNSPMTGDGGMFNQDELYSQGGIGINEIERNIPSELRGAIPLFRQALNAKRFEDCPSPTDWIRFSGVGSQFKPPSLAEIPDPYAEIESLMEKIRLAKERQKQEQHSAPGLPDKPDWGMAITKVSPAPTAPPLPPKPKFNP